jgi:deoxycytidylate deaminase
VFAVVGGAGSGTSVIAKTLRGLIVDARIGSETFDATILKASSVIREWARKNGKPIPPSDPKKLEYVEILQDYGDQMRDGVGLGGIDHTAVARELVAEIRKYRANKTNVKYEPRVEVKPDGKPRAYILDSIRHPAEVQLLRAIYGDAFILVGVVCQEPKRESRMTHKYVDAGAVAARKFMSRDRSDADHKHGQHVADAFELADFFVDNTEDNELSKDVSNPKWKANDDLNRLIKMVCGSQLERPKMAETAMYHAFSARMQSACLSRQVGAALVDRHGNVVATGTNEVPKAGGGVYGESSENEVIDARCAFYGNEGTRYCRNTREQNTIAEDLVAFLGELNITIPDKLDLPKELRRTRIGGLLEFSRAVHAEMDALLSAARKGISVVGTRLFVTTFPCHYCARHLVAAGVDEVQYIEPYPKSRALLLHDDSITEKDDGWIAPSEVDRLHGPSRKDDVNRKFVLFRPFRGVSPRLYRRTFLQSGDLKDKNTGNMLIHEPYWTSPWYLPKKGYISLEAALSSESIDHA